uniref:Uncharacterized protein n=1 Tax=Rhizophora mucronata TaxID=61149 RepID=A0A2P2NS57_RHIMU
MIFQPYSGKLPF